MSYVMQINYLQMCSKNSRPIARHLKFAIEHFSIRHALTKWEGFTLTSP